MKIIFSVLLILINVFAFSQQKDSLNLTKQKVTFITRLNIDESAGKGDVYYLNGYIVHIDWNEARRLNGKTLKISGEITLLKGIQNDEPPRQWYYSDTRHIIKPKIKVVKN